MEFINTDISGCKLIRQTPHGDHRGYFVRTFCAREFSDHGLNPIVAQASYSYSDQRGTLRGLHYQSYPDLEDKLVRCVRGSIFDVMVDLRPDSPSFAKWVGFELSETNCLQLHSTRGFAHGFQTLTDDCIVSYSISQFYDPNKSMGIRWNDPQIDIQWPLVPANQSQRDLQLPLLAHVDLETLMKIKSTDL